MFVAALHTQRVYQLSDKRTHAVVCVPGRRCLDDFYLLCPFPSACSHVQLPRTPVNRHTGNLLSLILFLW